MPTRPVAKVISPRRVALCRAVRLLMEEQKVTFVELARHTRGGVSDEAVRALVDDKRDDVPVRLEDLAAWARVLGNRVIDAWLRAEGLGCETTPLDVLDAGHLGVERATGGAMGAVAEVVSAIVAATADGVVDSAEAATVKKAAARARREIAQAEAVVAGLAIGGRR